MSLKHVKMHKNNISRFFSITDLKCSFDKSQTETWRDKIALFENCQMFLRSFERKKLKYLINKLCFFQIETKSKMRLF